MQRSEYMSIHIRIIPPDIITHYNWNELFDQYRWIYMEIIGGMEWQPTSGILAEKLLAKLLSNHVYYQVKKHKDCGNMCGEVFYSHW